MIDVEVVPGHELLVVSLGWHGRTLWRVACSCEWSSTWWNSMGPATDQADEHLRFAEPLDVA